MAELETEIHMGDCIQCKAPWSMEQSEWNWWDKRVKKRTHHWPKRCRECREKDKAQRTQSSTLLKSLIKDYFESDMPVGEAELHQRLVEILLQVEILEKGTERLPHAKVL